MSGRTKFGAAITTVCAVIAVLAVIAAGGGVIAAADTPNAADATKPGPTDSGLQLSSVDRERMERQKPLIAAADIIQAAVDTDTQADRLSGYSSIALGEQLGRAALEGGASRRSRQRSTRRARTSRSRSSARATPTPRCRPRPLRSSRRPRSRRAACRSPSRCRSRATRSASRSKVTSSRRSRRGLAALDLPVGVTPGDVPEPAGRLNDSAPVHGGGRIVGPAGGCTSGFAVTNWSVAATSSPRGIAGGPATCSTTATGRFAGRDGKPGARRQRPPADPCLELRLRLEQPVGLPPRRP